MPYAATEETDFLQELEARRGAPIGYRTFSTFYADSDGNLCDYGVFLYESGGRFWYQDFEHVPTFLGFRLPRRKDDIKYEMFESSFSPSDVVSFMKVTKASVRACVFGSKAFGKLKRANPILSFFRETVTEFRLSDGRRLYFQLIDKTVQNMIKIGESNGCIQSL